MESYVAASDEEGSTPVVGLDMSNLELAARDILNSDWDTQKVDSAALDMEKSVVLGMATYQGRLRVLKEWYMAMRVSAQDNST